MDFSHLVAYLKKLEVTSSQNAMIEILGRLFKEADPDEIGILCYFLLGEIAAGYQEISLDMGEKRALSSISLAIGVEEKKLEERLGEAGDLGALIAQYDVPPHAGGFTEYFSPPLPLTVRALHEGLTAIASASGEGSDLRKIGILASLLAVATPEERRYIVRLATGAMRLGVGDMTALDGLAVAFLGSKESRSFLEQAYNLCSDIGYVAEILQKDGLSGVKRIRITLNRPLRPMLAQRVSTMEEIQEKIISKEIAVEEKYDGERIQAHKDGEQVELFSRRLTRVTAQFPDVVREIKQHVRTGSAVLDGEVVAYNREKGTYEPFQTLMQRRRKYRVAQYAVQIPVRYMVFDLVYRDGSPLLDRSYPERRASLEEIMEPSELIAITDRTIASSLDGIRSYFEDCIKRGLEGVICKSMAKDSVYEAGSRSWKWIKWKQTYGSELPDTLDLVAIGGNLGRGSRAGTYGSLLCATYNPDGDVFESICGLGTGFSDEQLEELPDKFGKVRVGEMPARYRVKKEKYPDHWFNPAFVLEVLGSEITRSPMHTCNWDERARKGLAVRFPRFIRWRPEKSPVQATTSREIAELYRQKGKR
ncbi:MAG: ATP-dependent DNA ligase [Methanomicrobiales archaeon]|nr:ATP-dependent DNA ligase [Methanomicrobiales archaeon]